MKSKLTTKSENKPWTKKALDTFGFCLNHTAKMLGVLSISTSPLLNKFCQARCNDAKLICSKCFSIAQQKLYTNLSIKLAKNTDKLTKLIPIEELPLINPEKWPLLRFESFGDLNNKEQAMNYINIAIKNPKVKCALWTKNPLFVVAALKELGITKEMGLPSNLQIVLSSPQMNNVIDSNFWFISHVFTVFTKDYIEEHNVNINCGARSCMGCQRCYKGGEYFINEKLK